jgi:hypothetical protein
MLVLNLSFLEREYTLINVLKALASIISMCALHVIFLLKITPRYFTYIWNVPSIQCKKRLRWSNLMREVDCPSTVFIDFNVPTLTPSRH